MKVRGKNKNNIDYEKLEKLFLTGKEILNKEIKSFLPPGRQDDPYLTAAVDRLELPLWRPTPKSWKILTDDDIEQWIKENKKSN